jgi:hypothetical protein
MMSEVGNKKSVSMKENMGAIRNAPLSMKKCVK